MRKKLMDKMNIQFFSAGRNGVIVFIKIHLKNFSNIKIRKLRIKYCISTVGPNFCRINFATGGKKAFHGVDSVKRNADFDTSYPKNLFNPFR
jgi:hypothetical protein